MFKIFKRKSKVEKLESKYKKLLEESFILSTTNRKLSDVKKTEAEKVLNQIKLIKEK